MANPFPGGFTGPQGKQYGALANWGYPNNNDLGTTAARDAEIYQWNVGIQRIVSQPDCAGHRRLSKPQYASALGRHQRRDFIPSTLLAQITAAVTPTDSTCLADSCVSNFLQTQVGNPFYSMFNSPCTSTPSHPCFNEPNSNYGQSTLPLGTLLNKYPQFNGDFEGLMFEEAESLVQLAAGSVSEAGRPLHQF